MNENETRDRKKQETPENKSASRRWVKPTFERVPLKDAMSGGWDDGWSVRFSYGS
jgi:hypothetical protein